MSESLLGSYVCLRWSCSNPCCLYWGGRSPGNLVSFSSLLKPMSGLLPQLNELSLRDGGLCLRKKSAGKQGAGITQSILCREISHILWKHASVRGSQPSPQPVTRAENQSLLSKYGFLHTPKTAHCSCCPEDSVTTR